MRGLDRVVLFLDLDYFFAQVEEVENPAYRGRPLVVCVYSGRDQSSGVVSSANYEARKYGVKAGMPIKRAMALLPGEAVYLPVRLSHYAKVSEEVMAIAKRYSAKMRVESVDEAVLDLTDAVGGSYERAEEYARRLKSEILARKSLKCSVGVAPNRVLAKIAADASKPDGLKIVKPHEVADFLTTQPVNALPGIGLKTRQRLEAYGVKTVADLQKVEVGVLERIFGEKKARYVYLAARGEFDEPIQERGLAKQVSKILTLKRNTRDMADVEAVLAACLSEALLKLSTLNMTASRVGVIAITSEIKTITKQVEIRPQTPYDEIMKTLKKLLHDVLAENPSVMLRRVGVRLFGLNPIAGQSKLTAWSD
ncbi:MAG: DNA polymerase IV [Candidatus Caldarchaeum sp.]|nr:DNA polymerase IV [Candidatus Caldarchaeum sp.]